MNFTQYLFENTRLLEKNFVNGNKEQISFSNLYDRSCRMASFLSSKEGTNKNILLVAGNNVFFITGYLGIMMSGNVCVPLDPTIEKRNLDYIIKECDADTILIESRLQDKFNLNALNILTELNYTKIINSRPVFEKIENFSSEKTAQIIFTSGSTGVPKGVVLSHRNLIANTTSIIKYLKLTEMI